MNNQSSKGKRIAKNTIMMYIRMFITMGVSLYTSRIVLHALGVTDLGVYNVVGGLVTLFTFVNAAMMAATQRFLNFEIGQSNDAGLNTVFKSAYIIHIIIAAIIVTIGCTVGKYFLDHQLQIPANRHYAATVVLYLSCLTCALQVLTLPFSAVIVSHEKINIYAWFTIIECLLRFAVALMIDYAAGDRLIYYAILLTILQMVNAGMNIVYCYSNFKEVRGKLEVCKPKLKEMGQFAVWCLIGCTAGAFAGQGLNILLGVFFPPVVNAARAIAVQVQSAAMSFGSNLNTAMTPQITQSYASGDKPFFFNILYRGSKYVFFLMILIVIPLLLRTEYVVNIWLGEVPEYTVPFIQWLLCATLIESISFPLMRASDASGKIRVYHSVVGGILLLILPVAYIVLKYTMNPVSVFVVYFSIHLTAWFARLIILRKTVKLSVTTYMKNVMLTVSAVFLISYTAGRVITSGIPHTFWGLVATVLISIALSLTTSFIIGLDSKEKQFLLSKTKQILHLA